MLRDWKAKSGSLVRVAFCLAAGVLPAATLVQLSMNEMAQQATAIVRARVVSSSASFTGSTIYTHYKLQVTETWKAAQGAAPAEIMVPGGVANGYRQSFPGAPLLHAGSEYVLFLWTSQAGITHIIGLTQGLFNVATQTNGSVQATRQPSGETMLDASGWQVEDRGLQMGLADLKAGVAQALSAAAGAVQ